jgi:Tol biopolymer transport system component
MQRITIRSDTVPIRSSRRRFADVIIAAIINMDVTAGTRLGPYEIVAPLGAGGMGRVFRARDTRLKRDVALKVISDRVGDRADLRERFQREALAVAALNHPHICQVYDVGAERGVDFIVMELIEGETLSARLHRGRLPIADAVRVARELTAAVGAAHRAGVIHRDIKPSNIMLTRSGLKLLDFGLARQHRPAALGNSNSTLAPLTDPLTLTGMVLGTWQYMSPEQLRGNEADARSDVFSIGVVLYEAFTATRLFQRPTQEAALIAILEDEPAPMTAIRPDVPASIERVVSVCLAKDPADRWQAAGDLHHAIEANTGVSPKPARTLHSRAAAAIATAVVVVAALGAALWPRDGVDLDASGIIRSTVDVSPAITLPTRGPGVQFLPDGSGFIFGGRDDRGRNRLFRHDLAIGQTTAIDGTEGGNSPFLSPDGKWLGFWSDDYLMKAPIGGGPPLRIVEQPLAYGASWGDDGFIVYGGRTASGLRRVSASGGTPTEVSILAPEDHGEDHRYPEVLPGSRRILFSIGTGPEPSARVVGLDLATGQRKDIIRGAMSFRYLNSGHIAYVSNDTLFAVPFDAERLEVVGATVRIADGIDNFEGSPEFAFSDRGDLIYLPGSSAGPQHRVGLVSLTGDVQTVSALTGPFFRPRFSPDGGRLLVLRMGTKNNLWVYDLTRTTLSRVTYGRYQGAIWTRDGRITAPRGGPGNQRIVIRAADGTGDDGEPLTSGGTDEIPVEWTPDGQRLIYQRWHATNAWDLWTVSPRHRRVEPLMATRYNEQTARISPDGRLLAYVANDSGTNQVYVSSLGDDRSRIQVSIHGGASSVWAPDGRRLYFRGSSGDQQGEAMLSSDITMSSQLSASKPRVMFRNDGFIGPLDLSPDGQRFAMVQADTSGPHRQYRLVQNWQRLLSGQ